MKVLLSGGGTAGHVNPAISIAQYIRQKRPETQFLFVGKQGGIEERLVKNAGFDIKLIDIEGLDRKHPLKNIKIGVKAIASTAKAREIIEDFAPDIVIGTGGYVSFPTLNAACKMGIPTAIHEQNAFPGVTSKMLAKRVGRVMLGFEAGGQYFDKRAKKVFVGNPIREGFVFSNKADARKKLGISADAKYIVSFGGSMGAREFNKAIAGFMQLHCNEKSFMHTHATGKRGYEWMPALIEEYGVSGKVDLREYIENMQDVMAAADLIIARAGAITLAEITALGKASILIPSPNVTNNHQYHNAKSLADNGAAVMIEEKDLTPQSLFDAACEILEGENTLSQNASNMAVLDSAEKIYAVIKELLA